MGPPPGWARPAGRHHGCALGRAWPHSMSQRLSATRCCGSIWPISYMDRCLSWHAQGHPVGTMSHSNTSAAPWGGIPNAVLEHHFSKKLSKMVGHCLRQQLYKAIKPSWCKSSGTAPSVRPLGKAGNELVQSCRPGSPAGRQCPPPFLQLCRAQHHILQPNTQQVFFLLN